LTDRGEPILFQQPQAKTLEKMIKKEAKKEMPKQGKK
jgi:hypothetical protein